MTIPRFIEPTPISELPPICGTARLAMDRLRAEAAAHATTRRREAEQAEGVDFFPGARE